jgi:hypothetical protein
MLCCKFLGRGLGLGLDLGRNEDGKTLGLGSDM